MVLFGTMNNNNQHLLLLLDTRSNMRSLRSKVTFFIRLAKSMSPKPRLLTSRWADKVLKLSLLSGAGIIRDLIDNVLVPTLLQTRNYTDTMEAMACVAPQSWPWCPFKSFQWKCPLQNGNGLALSQMIFQACSTCTNKLLHCKTDVEVHKSCDLQLPHLLFLVPHQSIDRMESALCKMTMGNPTKKLHSRHA